MTKLCSRCDKSVYPTEELKCLDKIWHKTCFRCHECSMTLNMKTYKGFNKLPYCEAHIPKAKATTVTETPEMRRLAENTKLQSQVQYHADFEKAKGKFTQVADDPETLRIKANSKIISNVSYHGDLEKKAAMEQKRNLAGDDPTNGNHNDDSGSGTNSNRRRLKKHPPEAHPSRKTLSIPPAFLIKPVHGRIQCGTRKPVARGKPLKIPEAFLFKPPPPPPSFRTGKMWSRSATAPPSSNRRRSIDTDVSIPETSIVEASIPEASVPEASTPEALIPPVVADGFQSANFGHCAHCWTDVNGVHFFRNNQSIDQTVAGLLSEFIATTTPFQHLLIWM